MNQILMAPFSRAEGEKVVKGFNLTKAPGPDGFPAIFFQKYWDIVGPTTVVDCLTILNQKVPVKAWNHTNIALIPKLSNARLVSDYRPISLCNVSYKIITKVIANGLCLVLNDIIEEGQTTFIPGRSISDNMIIGHETLYFLKKKRRGKVSFTTLKIDMSKAYDRVEWTYLQQIMLKLGFQDAWIQLIMGCITSPTFSIIMNGEVFGHIQPSRGLR